MQKARGLITPSPQVMGNPLWPSPEAQAPRQGSLLLLSCERVVQSQGEQDNAKQGRWRGKWWGGRGKGSPSKGPEAECAWGPPGQERESKHAARTRFLLHPGPGQGRVPHWPALNVLSLSTAPQVSHQSKAGQSEDLPAADGIDPGEWAAPGHPSLLWMVTGDGRWNQGHIKVGSRPVGVGPRMVGTLWTESQR